MPPELVKLRVPPERGLHETSASSCVFVLRRRAFHLKDNVNAATAHIHCGLVRVVALVAAGLFACFFRPTVSLQRALKNSAMHRLRRYADLEGVVASAVFRWRRFPLVWGDGLARGGVGDVGRTTGSCKHASGGRLARRSPGGPVSRVFVLGRAVRHCTKLLCGKRCGNWPAVFRFNHPCSSLVSDRGKGKPYW